MIYRAKPFIFLPSNLTFGKVLCDSTYDRFGDLSIWKYANLISNRMLMGTVSMRDEHNPWEKKHA